MKVIKRDGSEVDFDAHKIDRAIAKAFEATGTPDTEHIMAITGLVLTNLKNDAVTVEEIQDAVEDALIATGYGDVAKAYIKYRYERALKRKGTDLDGKVLSLVEYKNEVVKQENSNKNPVILSTQRDYIAGEMSRHLTNDFFLPEDIKEAHEQGIIHFHDSDYFAQHMHNCDLLNLDDMLQNGTVISRVKIDKPHSFSTACNIATQIIAQVASSQYGGQTITLSHLAPFVDESRKRIREEVAKEMSGFSEIGWETENEEGETFYEYWSISDDTIETITEERLKNEIRRGVQTLQYQIVTLMTTNGQTPFVSVNMYLGEVDDPRTKADLALVIEEVLKQRICGVKNEKGVWVTPAFPKLLYVLEEDNINPDGKYYYLTELAAKCTAKRMVPDYISEKKMLELKIDSNGNGNAYPCMGCRSFLTPDRSGNGYNNMSRSLNYDGMSKYYGRFNQGVVTINLVDVACSSNGDEEVFWKIFEERLELCHRALRLRHERLLGTPSDVAPILWQYGALARLDKGEAIDPLLFDGYSTISLGYAGLAECVWRMKNCSHTSEEGRQFGLAVMQKLNDKCAEWKKAENIDYSVYGTPIESTTYKFAKCLKQRFGIIPHVTDKNYITNSYHVHVTEPINAFRKLELEAEFQALSPGGAISYVEVPNMQDNIPAVLSVIHFIYDHIIYAELNTKSDYCQECGYDGEIEIVEQGGKLIWRCPNCGNTDQSKMNIARRTCGYIGVNGFNQGRVQEIKERVLHL